MCTRLRSDPLDMLAVMNSESDVMARAQNRRSGAAGLIQLLPSTLRGVDWDHGPDAFCALRATDQLPYVERHLAAYATHGLGSAARIYQAVFLPATMLLGSMPGTVLTTRGCPAYDRNQGLDLDGDGAITLGDLAERVRLRQSGARWEVIVARLRAGSEVGSPERSGRVYLTFDDGPDPVWTPRVLDALAAAGVRATFFAIGERAARHPEVVQRTLAEGHAVELHCMRHIRHDHLSRVELEADVAEGLQALRAAGASPHLLRPPSGLHTGWSAEVADAHGLELMGWSADPADWLGDSLERMLERVAPDATAGRVVALHDAVGPGSPRTDCASTVELIAPLVELIRSRGLEPSPLGMGPARWRLASAPGDRGPVDVTLICEDDLESTDAAQVSVLLGDCITRHRERYWQRGWRRLRPAFRALARQDAAVVGQVSAFVLDTDPPRQAYGLGDLVVSPDRRGRGIARALLERVVEACMQQRGAELILTDTVLMTGVLSRLGFEPVERFAVYYERGDACRWHPRWLARGTVGSRLRIAEGDF